MVELRWIERDVLEPYSAPLGTSAGYVMNNVMRKKQFLQYRQERTFDGMPIGWTEWQDVPTEQHPAPPR
jgi:hypothetical protein